MTCGIYGIEDISGKRLYVGYAQNMDRRKKEHFSALRLGKHKNNFLQTVYNKYGENNLFFFLIEKCKPQELKELEIFYICYFDTRPPNGFNLTSGGDGLQNPDEFVKNKISISNKGVSRNWSDVEKKKKWFSGKNNPNFGKSMSLDTKMKMIESKRKTQRLKPKKIIKTRDEIKKENGSTSIYSGVTYKKDKLKWKAYARGKNKKQVHAGYFDNEIDAAIAHDDYIMKNNLVGRLNFPKRVL